MAGRGPNSALATSRASERERWVMDLGSCDWPVGLFCNWAAPARTGEKVARSVYWIHSSSTSWGTYWRTSPVLLAFSTSNTTATRDLEEMFVEPMMNAWSRSSTWAVIRVAASQSARTMMKFPTRIISNWRRVARRRLIHSWMETRTSPAMCPRFSVPGA